MDRYKFRGKRLDNGEWVEGDLIKECTGETFIVVSYLYGEYGEKVGRDYHAVDQSTVGQYTGLKDKNGKEIYEGDIVKYDDDVGKIVYFVSEAMYMIEFDTYVNDFDHIHSREVEVIGNIHDNPSLLKGE